MKRTTSGYKIGISIVGNYNADVELFAGCLRIYAEGDSYEAGDKYLFACSLHWLSKTEVELKGVCEIGDAPIRYRREICTVLQSLGVEVLQCQRKDASGTRTVRMDTGTGKLIR